MQKCGSFFFSLLVSTLSTLLIWPTIFTSNGFNSNSLKCNLNYEFETNWDVKVEKWNPFFVECDPLEGFVGSKSKEFLGYFSCGCCWVIELLFNLKFETYNSIFAMYVEEFYPICEMLLWVLIGNKAYKYCMLRLKINLLF